MTERVATIDGQTVATAADVHRQLNQQLDFGPYYGNNFSALEDRLRYDIERPARVVWTSAALSRQRLGDVEMDAFLAVFDRVVKSDEGSPEAERFSYEMRP